SLQPPPPSRDVPGNEGIPRIQKRRRGSPVSRQNSHDNNATFVLTTRYRYVFACSKFSIGCTADFNSPQLANFVWLVKSQMPVANDLSSWTKEKKAYDAGKIKDMINSVEVTKRLFSLPNERASFAVTYAFQ